MPQSDQQAARIVVHSSGAAVAVRYCEEQHVETRFSLKTKFWLKPYAWFQPTLRIWSLEAAQRSIPQRDRPNQIDWTSVSSAVFWMKTHAVVSGLGVGLPPFETGCTVSLKVVRMDYTSMIKMFMAWVRRGKQLRQRQQQRYFRRKKPNVFKLKERGVQSHLAVLLLC